MDMQNTNTTKESEMTKRTYENPYDLDRTGRCRECEALYTKPHIAGCSYGPGKVGSLRRTTPVVVGVSNGVPIIVNADLDATDEHVYTESAWRASEPAR